MNTGMGLHNLMVGVHDPFWAPDCYAYAARVEQQRYANVNNHLPKAYYSQDKDVWSTFIKSQHTTLPIHWHQPRLAPQ